MRQLALDISAVHTPTFENFVIGRNAEVLGALRAAAGSKGADRFVYVWGRAGSGKSHLLQAAVSAATAAGSRAAYVPGRDGVIPDGSSADLVAVDDVDRLDGIAQVALFNLCNTMREGTGVLLAAGPVAPPGLGLREDLVTRLAWGLVYQLHPLDDDEKAQALRAHAKARGFDLPREVCGFLLRHSRRDLPSLVATVEALDRMSLETRRPVTVPLLKEVLQLPLDLGEGDGR